MKIRKRRREEGDHDNTSRLITESTSGGLRQGVGSRRQGAGGKGGG